VLDDWLSLAACRGVEVGVMIRTFALVLQRQSSHPHAIPAFALPHFGSFSLLYIIMHSSHMQYYAKDIIFLSVECDTLEGGVKCAFIWILISAVGKIHFEHFCNPHDHLESDQSYK
jgi:hypothetical protein